MLSSEAVMRSLTRGAVSVARRNPVVVFIAGAALTALCWTSLSADDAAPQPSLLKSLSWRAKLYALKVRGGIPELWWSDLWHMSRQSGGFGLERIIDFDISLAGSVRNPHITNEDRRTGATIFHERCEGCHGTKGAGGHAPALNKSGLSRGDSDLALYTVLRDGIPGTGMAAPDLTILERWQIVAHVRALQVHGTSSRAAFAPGVNVSVSTEQIARANAHPDSWLTYSGTLDGHRYTPLTHITRANVSQLKLRWSRSFRTTDPTIEATPLVVGGVIFTTYPPANVVAIEAKSAKVLWTHTHPLPRSLPLCCGRMNRGLAIRGNTLFFGSLDGVLTALNANTGKVLWETRVADPSQGYTMTGAPLIANDLVIVGIAGGEYAIRGFVAAYDAVTGERRWKFSTIPGPGEKGHETWENDAWRTGGGATWVTGSYDPELDLLYWGTGNPAPDFAKHLRPGDNLFTNSVVALHARSGKLAWHFQFLPQDEYDWDSNQTPILADLVIRGQVRKTICWANRNGFYYVLDRTTGEFLVGVPYVELNWALGLDAGGRPIHAPQTHSSKNGRLVKPGAGGTNWQNPAFDTARGLIFVPATEGAAVLTVSPDATPQEPGTMYLGSRSAVVAESMTPSVRALEATTGARRWEYSSPAMTDEAQFSGLLATGGGLVFGASGGVVFALDSDTGRELWRVFLGGDTRAAPISFTIDGRQVIAVSAGQSLFVFGL
jgi:alcohol dehydrogenase (cytochrome c)